VNGRGVANAAKFSGARENKIESRNEQQCRHATRESKLLWQHQEFSTEGGASQWTTDGEQDLKDHQCDNQETGDESRQIRRGSHRRQSFKLRRS
jgi:hypothetical protein